LPWLARRSSNKTAETHVTQALSIDYENVEAWALWGHVKYLQLDFEAAKGICRLHIRTKMFILPFSGRYQRTLMFAEKPSDLHTLYIRLGAILLSESNVSIDTVRELFIQSSCFFLSIRRPKKFSYAPAVINQHVLPTWDWAWLAIEYDQAFLVSSINVDLIQMNQYDDAEEALTEANFLNNQNAGMSHLLSTGLVADAHA
jgi:tetratricopeptide (TPR) repeat protein